jgi:hypothetical protein
MNLAIAKALAASILDSGREATVEPIRDMLNQITDYKVTARADDINPATINAVKTLQDAHGVTGKVREVVFT